MKQLLYLSNLSNQIKWMKTFSLIFFILTSISVFAQAPNPNTSCTSGDLELAAAVLPPPGDDPCACGGTRTLMLSIRNKTGSERTSFAFWGTLKVYNSDGTLNSSRPLTGCNGPIKKNTDKVLGYSTTTLPYGNITFECGQSLVITDLFLAWTDAAPGSTCPLNPATINPKCGKLPSIPVIAGIDAGLAVTDATCTTQGSITVSPFGGTAPYKVKLGTDERTNIASGASVTFSNLGAAVHSFTITDSRPCSTVKTREVKAPNAIPTPAASVDQTTCASATGTVTLTTSLASGVTYTLKQLGVVKYTANAQGVFNLVVAGTYVLNGSNGTCSANGDNVVVNSQPQTPGTPSAGVTQPTCLVATGSIAVINADETITYTLTGPSPSITTQSNTTGQFPGLDAGSYGLTASKNGCTSPSASKTVDPQPQTPGTPAADVTQPTCAVATGSIAVTNADATITYTLTGPSPASTTQTNSTGNFPNLDAGNYSLTASKNGCTSLSASKTVNAQPQTPGTPTAGVTQPTCSVATGTIAVTNANQTITYTLTGPSPASTTQSNTTGSFPGLAAGSYSLTATKDGCTSPSATKIVNAQPSSPTFTVCIVQPTLCAKGSLTINASGGSGLKYSIDGADFSNTTGVFSNLGAASVTSVQVKNADGCFSSPVSCANLVEDCSAKSAIAARTSTPVIQDQVVTVKAYPNPFSKSVKFAVYAPKAGQASLDVYNTMGQKIKTVFRGYVPAGLNNFELSLPTQKYASLIYRFMMDKKQISGKVIQMGN